MLRLIALQGVRAHENMEHYHAGKTLYIGIKPSNRALTTIGKQTTNHAK